jgi:ParB family chromosome partitioning protein
MSLFKETIEKNLSVRQTEDLVKSVSSKPKKMVAAAKTSSTDVFLRKMQDEIGSALSTKVNIIRTKEGKGEIVIKFYNDNDLERLSEILKNH